MWVRVYFKTRNYDDIRRILTRFNLGPSISVNYESFGNVPDKDMWLLQETARRNFIEIRKIGK